MPEELAVYPWKGMIYGFDFDADNVLWYGLLLHPKPEAAKNGVKNVEVACYLCSWNFLQGGKPVCYGLMGTERRRARLFSEAHITKNLFIGADTNHEWDPVSMFQVDLNKLKADHAAGIRGPLTRDPWHYTNFQQSYDIYPGDLGKDIAPVYEKKEKERVRTERYLQMAAEFGVTGAKEIYVTKFWRHIGYENANIVSIRFETDGTLTVVCGKTEFYEFKVKKGEILSKIKSRINPDPKAVDAGRIDLEKKYEGVRLPSYAGRRWVAAPTAEALWHNGGTIVGTKDGLLAIVKDGKAYALGGLGVCGPVRDLCVNASKTKLWGVAGDIEDLGMLFTYDDTEGLVQIGPVEGRDIRPEIGEPCLLNVLSAVAVYGDGNVLAVGSADYKAALIEYYF
jgi:hypothetical protein